MKEGWKIQSNYQSGINDRKNGHKICKRAVKEAEKQNQWAMAYIAGYNNTPYCKPQ